jgi:hypothetical protein
MTPFTVKWSSFEVIKKHDIDRDKPYLWVFGIVVDATSIVSGDYMIRKPAGSDNLDHMFKKGDVVPVPGDLDISRDVTPLLGLAAAGVVIVSWENAMTSDSVTRDAYAAAARTINGFVADTVDDVFDQIASGKPIDDVDFEPTDAQMTKLRSKVETAVRNTMKDNWTVCQLIPDNNIGTAYTFLSLDEDVHQFLTYRFVKGSTDYELRGDLTYGHPTVSGPPSGDGSIQTKHESTKPTSNLPLGR